MQVNVIPLLVTIHTYFLYFCSICVCPEGRKEGEKDLIWNSNEIEIGAVISPLLLLLLFRLLARFLILWLFFHTGRFLRILFSKTSVLPCFYRITCPVCPKGGLTCLKLFSTPLLRSSLLSWCNSKQMYSPSQYAPWYQGSGTLKNIRLHQP